MKIPNMNSTFIEKYPLIQRVRVENGENSTRKYENEIMGKLLRVEFSRRNKYIAVCSRYWVQIEIYKSSRTKKGKNEKRRE